VEPLLSFAEELERRDTDVAQQLLEVEKLQADVDQLRSDATAAAAFLASLPAAHAEVELDEHAATAARAQADAAVRDAEAASERAQKEAERLSAARALQQARDHACAAELWTAQAREARERLEGEGAARHAESELLARRAAELAGRVRDVPAPQDDLEGALEWASRARGALLIERSALTGERDKLVREASELVASVLGEPLTATAVAGVRDRLERALESSSA